MDITSKQLIFLKSIFSYMKDGNFEIIFDLIFEKLREFIPYTRIGIGIINGDEVQSIANRSSCNAVQLKIGYSLKIEETSLGTLVENRKTRIINDLASYYKEHPNSESTSLLLEEGILSSATIPIIIDNKVKGFIFFSDTNKDSYKEEHILFLKQIVIPLSMLVENGRLVSRLKDENRELEELNSSKREFVSRLSKELDKQTKELAEQNNRYKILLNITNSASVSTKIDSILREAFDSLKDYLNISALSFMRKSFRKDKIKFIFTNSETQITERFFIFDTIFSSKKFFEKLKRGEKLDSGELVNSKSKTFLSKKEINYSLYIPLSYQDKFLGVLVISREKYKKFSKKEELFLKEIKDLFNIIINNMLKLNKIYHDKTLLKEKSNYLSDEIKTNFGDIVGDSARLRQLIKEVKLVAPTQATVLIKGETGVGKELIARAIHNNSKRKDKIFIKVNCAALSDSIITSEFFGHEKGAFTGAIDRKIGKFELANGGTIFLDEIGEIPLDIQVKLLRVLQERELERVGGNKTIPLDIRIIAATNRDLEDDIKNKLFRADLFYRLNVFPLYIPSLKERKNDILILSQYFLKKYSDRMGKHISKISEKTKEFLLHYDFPGNIRELENMIERGVILAENNILILNPLNYNYTTEIVETHIDYNNTFLTLDKMIEIHLRKALEKSNGKIHGDNGCAKLLGLKPTTLQSKLKKYGLR